jgi:Zn-dependent peptidase ImmA (M78 family)/transcriptional regulator with XRE-family HTH domain
MVSSQAQFRLPISSEALRKARRRLGLERSSLAEYLNRQLGDLSDPVTSADIEDWEAARQVPTIEQSEGLASVLFIPFAGLLDGAGDVIPSTAMDFRRGPGGRARPLSYETHAKLERFAVFYRLARELAHATGSIEDASVPQLENERDREAAGDVLRAALGITHEARGTWASEDDALAWVTKAVEATGVFVFSLSMDVDEVRGASKWERGGPPAVLLNTADSVAARLFSLAHEYAHLVRGHPEEGIICDPSTATLDVEAWANQVAAAALVPRQEVLNIIQGEKLALPTSYREWPRQLRIRLRSHFRVSHDVLGIRLLHLRLVTDAGLTKGFWRRRSSFGRSSGTLANRYRKYLGGRTIRLARTAVEDRAMSPVQIARLLGIRVEHVEGALQSQ